ncbi:TPA: translation initiation factor IF-2 subunit gamma [Candidatus Micrarchaeota archaeon]|nr:translation initiation factor IF-2 subunit gamma [Candidatus Micrarchaeota archaeon]
MQAELNSGLLGHVDHGKTSLTHALSGKWTDTHSEEIKRGISIRLGYADFSIYYCDKCKAYSLEDKCSKCKGKAKLKRKMSLVDAPGHETLMTTVISAASILDGALFLVAANEPCPQPQSAEHLLVLDSTKIKNVIVVQTKVDLVSKEQAMENHKQIKAFLKGTVAENAPIIPISAHYNLNIDGLLEAMDKMMVVPEQKKDEELRLYVSRSFDVNHPGSEINKLNGGVIGGSIVQGTLKIGDEVEIKPGIARKEGENPKPITCKVTSLMEESEKLETASPGGLIAVGTSIDPALAKSDALVGAVLGRKGKVPNPIGEIKVKYELLKREDMDNVPLKEGEPVVVNVHASTGVGMIADLSKGVATIKLKKPTVVYDGMYVALSRRMGQRWRLSAWGNIV